VKNSNRLIMGAAISLAAILVAADHTKHRLPTPVEEQEQITEQSNIVIEGEEDASPCSMNIESDNEVSSPCGFGD